MIKVFIADDHKMMRDGLKALLTNVQDIKVLGEAANGMEVLEFIAVNQVDVLILDINMPGLDGVEVCKAINKKKHDVKILALTMYNEASMIANLIKNGASGYILKNAGKDKLELAIKKVFAGEQYFSEEVKETYFSGLLPKENKQGKSAIPKLTRREKEIISLILKEFTTAEIAEKLFISEKTVETHRMHLLQKFNVRNTAGLVRLAVEQGLADGFA